MGVEQQLASDDLEYNAPNTPNIRREGPPHFEYDLRCSVLPRVDDSGLPLTIERCTSKIDDLDRRIVHVPIAVDLRVWVSQQHIFEFQVSVDELRFVVIVCEGFEQLSRYTPHTSEIQAPVYLINDIEKALAQPLKHDADVPMKVKPLEQLGAKLMVPNLFQHFNLVLRILPVPLHISHYLDCNHLVVLPVKRFHHFAKSALSK
mmetsp:Transcript_11261/g.29686  ORF Transcript_11261/g.29686 Transcript_11261/m.29686 type:complete len:204 (+) Transcript_11261:5482-6093(+)